MRGFIALAGAALAATVLLASAAPGAERPVVLPADEAAHPEAKSERWELAGHVRSPSGRTFGLLAAFRRGDHQALGKGSLLTLAVVDVEGGLTYSDVNLISGPSSTPAPGRLRLAWEGSLLERPPDGGELTFLGQGVDDRSRAPMTVSLKLKPVSSPALLGAQGIRPFGSSANPALQHATSRLKAEGTIALWGTTHRVEGLLWLTHLWGSFDGTGKAFDGLTSWTAHLEDGRDLRIETFRGVRQGEAVPPTALWVEDGSPREEPLGGPPEVAGRWRSIRGISYPVAWRIPLAGGELSCRARLPDGEVLYELRLYLATWTSLSWVGSCGLEGTIDGKPVRGEALIEATGFEPPK